MGKIVISYALFVAIIVITLTIVVYEIFKIKRTIKYASRIDKFTLKLPNEKQSSVFDDIFASFDKFISKLSTILSKSSYFQKRSVKYSKYQVNGSDNLFGYQIFASKFVIGFLCFILYFLVAAGNKSFEFGLGLLWMVLGYFVLDVILAIYYNWRVKHIEEDLLKAVIIMNNAFKSGMNIANAINVIVRDMKGPVREEFIKIHTDLKYGLELNDAFSRFYSRVKISDAEYITSSLSILNVTGGNVTYIFSNIEDALTNKKRLKDEFKAMTGASLLVYRILLFMPFILILLILLLNKSYFEPLFESVFGYLIMAMALLLYILYIFIVKKIMKVNV